MLLGASAPRIRGVRGGNLNTRDVVNTSLVDSLLVLPPTEAKDVGVNVSFQSFAQTDCNDEIFNCGGHSSRAVELQLISCQVSCEVGPSTISW